MENLKENTVQEINLIVTEEMRSYLYDTTKWTSFIAYFGFVLSGLLLLISLSISSIIQSINPKLAQLSDSITVIYILLSLIILYPSILLLKFSKTTKNAVLYGEQENLNHAIKTLKSYFKFQGLTIIIVLGFYLVAILTAVFSRL
ncbi:MAG: hypothetical protein K2Q03_05575 [Sphingobacteriaceae bacterium]|nr:hypothetical protein [Sphingobacteriaceae bacterium]